MIDLIKHKTNTIKILASPAKIYQDFGVDFA